MNNWNSAIARAKEAHAGWVHHAAITPGFTVLPFGYLWIDDREGYHVWLNDRGHLARTMKTEDMGAGPLPSSPVSLPNRPDRRF